MIVRLGQLCNIFQKPPWLHLQNRHFSWKRYGSCFNSRKLFSVNLVLDFRWLKLSVVNHKSYRRVLLRYFEGQIVNVAHGRCFIITTYCSCWYNGCFALSIFSLSLKLFQCFIFRIFLAVCDDSSRWWVRIGGCRFYRAFFSLSLSLLVCVMFCGIITENQTRCDSNDDYLRLLNCVAISVSLNKILFKYTLQGVL